MLAAIALLVATPVAGAQVALPETDAVQLPVTAPLALPDGTVIDIPETGVIPVPIVSGEALPAPADGGPLIPLAPGTDDTRLCMIALADLEAVREMVRSARRAVRRRSTPQRRAALLEAKALRVEARAAKRDSCL